MNYWNSKRNAKKSKPDRRKFTILQEFIIVLMRLRGGFLIQDLAYRFNVSPSLIRNISITWIQCMYAEFTEHSKPKMFPSREQIAQNKPTVFKSFKNIRVILDCMEVFCQQPKNFEHQGNVYSQYKAHTTFKLLLGITPNGAISFISEAFEGPISDRQVVTDSNLLDLIEPGDLFLADKGFTIEDILGARKVQLNIPHF